MTIERWLRDNTGRLAKADIASARLDCLILLEDELGQDRSWLLAHPEVELSDKQHSALDTKVAEREQHMPLAYIRGRSEFYGRTFSVNHHVLEPRPETEDIISLLKGLELPEHPVIVDVGAGSGAIAVTAKLELPHARMFGTDIDPECLVVATRNAQTHGADVSFVQADLLEPTDGTLPEPDAILANLPYVPDSFHINPAAMNEPHIAIFGGPDGLDLYRRMFTQIQDCTSKPSYVITEALPPTHEQLTMIAKENGYGLVTVAGFAQLFRAA